MKMLRVVGLLAIVLSLAMGAANNAQALLCPDPSVFEGGSCYDGPNNYCDA